MKFNIRVIPSGVVFEGSSESSILQSALNAGVYLEHSCKDGSCGKCKAKVVSGQVVQQEVANGISESDINRGYALTCCVKPVTNLELEAKYYPELQGVSSSVQPCKVEMLSFPVADVCILKLKLPPNAKFQYLAGQYVQLIIEGKRRSYSIANISEIYAGIELHIKKVANGLFSDYIFNELKINQLLRLEGPAGSFFMRKGNAPIIFLVGGTGFAPVKAMVEKLLKEDSIRAINIYWGNSSINGFYSDLPLIWEYENDNIKYIPVYSGEDKWDGRKGLVHAAVLEKIKSLSLYEVYACGSPKMIEAAQHDFIAKGLNPDKFYSDAFFSSD